MSKCAMCGGSMTTAREEYQYKESGLPNVTLANVEVRRCPCGEEEVVIPAIESLHRAIAMVLIKKREPLAAAEVRFLREYLGWSGADFARHMGVSRFQVSRWETGSASPSAIADRLIRAMVFMKAPVEDYSVDAFSEIAAERKRSGKRAKLAPVTMRRSRKDWQYEQAVG